MSTWLSQSTSSNRWKQSYINGFVDISGGNLILRNSDASFNGNISIAKNINLINVLLFKTQNIQFTSSVSSFTATYPLYQTYNLTSQGYDGTISVPSIFTGGIEGSMITFCKSDSSDNLTINSSASEKFVQYGYTYSTLSPTSYTLPYYRSSVTFLAVNENNNYYYWMEVGSSIGNDLSLNGNLQMNGNNILSTNAGAWTAIGKKVATANQILDVSGNVQITGTTSTIKSANLIVNNNISIGTTIAAATGYILDISGNVKIAGGNNTVQSSNTIVYNNMSIGKTTLANSGYTLDISGNVAVSTNINYTNVILFKKLDVTFSSSPFRFNASYPIYQTYNITDTVNNGTIVMPLISTGNIFGTMITFCKSASSNTTLTIQTVDTDMFVQYGMTYAQSNGYFGYTMPPYRTSVTFCALSNGGQNYWVEVGSSIGNDLSLNGNLQINGNNVLSTNSGSWTTIGKKTATSGYNLDISGNVAISANLTVGNGVSISGNYSGGNALIVNGNTYIVNSTGNALTISGNALISGTLTYANAYIQKCLSLTTTPQTLSYPLYQSYNIATNSNTTITLPNITSAINGIVLNFFKSVDATIVATINNSGGSDVFIVNGNTTSSSTSTFTLPNLKTSTTLLATYVSGGTSYWTEVGSGGGSNHMITGLYISGAYTGIDKLNSTDTLQVSGTVIATSYNATSDRRLKTNILPLSSQSDSILQIQPVTFDWTVDGRKDIGFIAQNVYNTYPELRPDYPNRDPNSNIDEPLDLSGNPLYYSIDYGHMTPFLWQGMREIIQRLDKLEKENAELRSRMDLLTASNK